jgi:hypothetical protein
MSLREARSAIEAYLSSNRSWASPVCRRLQLRNAIFVVRNSQFEPRTTLRALSYFEDGDLPKLPGAMQNALRSAAAGVKSEELPALIGNPNLAARSKER